MEGQAEELHPCWFRVTGNLNLPGNPSNAPPNSRQVPPSGNMRNSAAALGCIRLMMTRTNRKARLNRSMTSSRRSGPVARRGATVATVGQLAGGRCWLTWTEAPFQIRVGHVGDSDRGGPCGCCSCSCRCRNGHLRDTTAKGSTSRRPEIGLRLLHRAQDEGAGVLRLREAVLEMMWRPRTRTGPELGPGPGGR